MQEVVEIGSIFIFFFKFHNEFKVMYKSFKIGYVQNFILKNCRWKTFKPVHFSPGSDQKSSALFLFSQGVHNRD